MERQNINYRAAEIKMPGGQVIKVGSGDLLNVLMRSKHQIFCDGCCYQHNTEMEQNTFKKGCVHLCIKDEEIVLKHGSYHPHLPKPKDCMGPYKEKI